MTACLVVVIHMVIKEEVGLDLAKRDSFTRDMMHILKVREDVKLADATLINSITYQ